jgi:S1 RNA binding domain protein
MQLEIGKIVEGKVTGITKFGAFVDLGEGRTGMVHISEVAPTYVKEITDFLTQGQDIRVKILNIAPDGKISLSVKQAMDPPPQARQGQRPFRPRQDRPGQDRPGQGRPGQGRPEGPRMGGGNGNGPRRDRGGDRAQADTYRAPRDWNATPRESGSKDFEDMLSKFMARSDEKISDLKRNTDGKRGSFGGRRSGKQQG